MSSETMEREWERGPWNIRVCLPDGCGWFFFSPSESRHDARFPDQYTAQEIADLARVACAAAGLVAVDRDALRAADELVVQRDRAIDLLRAIVPYWNGCNNEPERYQRVKGEAEAFLAAQRQEGTGE